MDKQNNTAALHYGTSDASVAYHANWDKHLAADDPMQHFIAKPRPRTEPYSDQPTAELIREVWSGLYEFTDQLKEQNDGTH